MEKQQQGSKAYLFSIVAVAVLGGLLFGYDTAVISGAEKGLQAFFLGAKDFTYTDVIHGLTSSSALIGCIIGSAISGYLAGHLGRRPTLIISGLFFFLSALGSYYPEFFFFAYGEPSLSLLVALNIYRIIGGVGVGLASAICPMYIAEVAPSGIRGTLVSWNQFAIIFGQLVVYFVNFLILGEHTNPIIERIGETLYQVSPQSDPWTIQTGWRYMFGSEAYVALLFTVLVCFVPESPRFLALTGRDSKALAVLTRINGSKAAEILREIKSTVEVKSEKLFSFGFTVIFVGVMLSVFQQIVGINAVLYYAPRIFDSMGMDSHNGRGKHRLHPRGSVHGGETRPQAAAHHRLSGNGRRSDRRRSQQPRDYAPDGSGDFHHDLFSLVHVLVGPDMLGAHLRDFPQHHPFIGRGCRRRIPVDIQLHRVELVRAPLQHAGRLDGRELRPCVCLRHVRRILRDCRMVCLPHGA